MHQFNAQPSVQYSWWEPSEFTPPEAVQTHAAQPKQIEATAPVGQVHHGICSLGEMGLPMFGHVTSSWQVQCVVTPAFGHGIDSHNGPGLVRPLGVAVRVAVELHPFRSEVPEEWDLSSFWVHSGLGQLSPLYCHINTIHPSNILHPRQGVFCVQDNNQTGTMARILLLPQLQQLGQMETLITYIRALTH